MDVRLSRIWGIFFLTIISLFFSNSCGKRLDMSTAYGRQGLIDQTNQYLSAGNCNGAMGSIDQLYFSSYVNEEIVILKASAYACNASFSLINLVSNLAAPVSQIPNTFAALAHTIPFAGGAAHSDGRLDNLYSAVDILTGGNSVLQASLRTVERNNYMIFLQLGLFGAVLSNYGSPNPTTGAKGAPLVYATMATIDSCAMMASIATIVDSFAHASLSGDPNINNAVTLFNAACAATGKACAALGMNRNACNAVDAAVLVGAVNAAW